MQGTQCIGKAPPGNIQTHTGNRRGIHVIAVEKNLRMLPGAALLDLVQRSAGSLQIAAQCRHPHTLDPDRTENARTGSLVTDLLKCRQVLPACAGFPLHTSDARRQEVADNQRIRRAAVADTGQVPVQQLRSLIQGIRFVKHQCTGNVQK
ncbi:hypothetical protein D3C76_1014920 [compost metagenome]